MKLYPRIMIRSYRGVTPQIASSAYIDPSAQVIGDVTVGERSSIWPNASVRGDVGPIRIGSETSIQDNCALHLDDGFPLTIGDRVTVGHSVVLHGCTIEDESLIGIGSIVLNGARIGKGSVIAAGALVPEGMEVPPSTLVMGVPAKPRRPVTPDEQARFRENVQNYVDRARLYNEDAAKENQPGKGPSERSEGGKT
jgi:carbonic anhydrase/acetyltransferase-like protein (isoleucine patch superfamily)